MILSGESGCGKTNICTRIVAMTRARGLAVTGVVTLPRLVDGRKVGLDVEDIRSGRRRPLAEAYAESDPSIAGATTGPSTGSWQFYADGLAWGAMLLRRATPCDLLVIDELGPLELLQGEGWTVGLEILGSSRYRMALVTVRPGLLPQFQEQLAPREPIILTVTRVNRDALPAHIIALLGVSG
ncbi:MAG: nucleoside-triphosphatase [Anaerolineae bacterium]